MLKYLALQHRPRRQFQALLRWEEGVPLLGQEGWTRHQENTAKPPLKGADGVVSPGKCLTTDHPVCAA
jgi:hypothetical protein